MTTLLQTWRCSFCSRIAAKLKLSPGSEIEIVHGCNRLLRLEATADGLIGDGRLEEPRPPPRLLTFPATSAIASRASA